MLALGCEVKGMGLFGVCGFGVRASSQRAISELMEGLLLNSLSGAGFVWQAFWRV